MTTSVSQAARLSMYSSLFRLAQARPAHLSRLLSQPSSASAARTGVPRPSWAESLPARPTVHRQNPRWRPPPPPTPSHVGVARQPGRTTDRMEHLTQSIPSMTTRTASSDSRTRLFISYHDLERALERRGLKSIRVILAAAAALAASVGIMWPRIKQWGAVEGAEVAAASLEHEQLQMKAVGVLNDVLTDPKTASQVEMLLKNAIVNLFRDDEFTQWAVDWTSKVLVDAMQQQVLVEGGSEYVKTVLAEEQSVKSAKEFFVDAFQGVAADEDLQDRVASVSCFCRVSTLFFVQWDDKLFSF